MRPIRGNEDRAVRGGVCGDGDIEVFEALSLFFKGGLDCPEMGAHLIGPGNSVELIFKQLKALSQTSLAF